MFLRYEKTIWLARLETPKVNALKQFCQQCGNPVEFNLDEFKQAGTSSVNCPHCNALMRLYETEKPPVVVSPPQVKKGATNSEVVALFALICFFSWSALILFWGAGTFFGWVKGGVLSPSNSDAQQVGAFFGVVISLAILFGVWLLGAVPSFLLWFIFKKK